MQSSEVRQLALRQLEGNVCFLAVFLQPATNMIQVSPGLLMEAFARKM